MGTRVVTGAGRNGEGEAAVGPWMMESVGRWGRIGREARVFRQWERHAHVVQLRCASLQAHAWALPLAVINEQDARREQEQQRGGVGTW